MSRLILIFAMYVAVTAVHSQLQEATRNPTESPTMQPSRSSIGPIAVDKQLFHSTLHSENGLKLLIIGISGVLCSCICCVVILICIRKKLKRWNAQMKRRKRKLNLAKQFRIASTSSVHMEHKNEPQTLPNVHNSMMMNDRKDSPKYNYKYELDCDTQNIFASAIPIVEKEAESGNEESELSLQQLQHQYLSLEINELEDKLENELQNDTKAAMITTQTEGEEDEQNVPPPPLPPLPANGYQ